MLITIDVGNSHTVIGIYEGERLRNHWRISTVHDRTTDEHGALLNTLLAAAGLGPGAEARGRRDRVRGPAAQPGDGAARGALLPLRVR